LGGAGGRTAATPGSLSSQDDEDYATPDGAESPSPLSGSRAPAITAAAAAEALGACLDDATRPVERSSIFRMTRWFGGGGGGGGGGGEAEEDTAL